MFSIDTHHLMRLSNCNMVGTDVQANRSGLAFLNIYKGPEDFFYDGTKKGINLKTQANRWAVKISGNWRISFQFESVTPDIAL